MSIDPDRLLALEPERGHFKYDQRDTMLYALGVGLGRDPLDQSELRFVFEKGLKTVPTMAALCANGTQALFLRTGIDLLRVVHGEQRVELHAPWPVASELAVETRITGVFDKGAGKGAIVLFETVARNAASTDPLCTLRSTIFARGQGGFTPDGQSAALASPTPHVVPDREPDIRAAFATREDQALLYRLSGDWNPLHASPDIAKRAGFERPILHGLCTYGVACTTILKHACDYDSARIRVFDGRFCAPVIPGETLETDIWIDGDCLSYRTRAKERDVLVIDNGLCLLNSTNGVAGNA